MVRGAALVLLVDVSAKATESVTIKQKIATEGK